MRPDELQISPALVDDKEAVSLVNIQPLVGLKHPFDQLRCNCILKVPAEVRQEEQTFLDDANVGVLKDAYFSTKFTLLKVWLQFIPDPLLFLD